LDDARVRRQWLVRSLILLFGSEEEEEEE